MSKIFEDGIHKEATEKLELLVVKAAESQLKEATRKQRLRSEAELVGQLPIEWLSAYGVTNGVKFFSRLIELLEALAPKEGETGEAKSRARGKK